MAKRNIIVSGMSSKTLIKNLNAQYLNDNEQYYRVFRNDTQDANEARGVAVGYWTASKGINIPPDCGGCGVMWSISGPYNLPYQIFIGFNDTLWYRGSHSQGPREWTQIAGLSYLNENFVKKSELSEMLQSTDLQRGGEKV